MPITPEDKRCWHVTLDGKRCRMDKLEQHPSLCYYHWEREQQMADAMKFSAQVVPPRARLNTARGINRVLGNVLKALSQGKIPARSAAGMAYIGQLLLLSLPYLQKERAQRQELAPNQGEDGLSELIRAFHTGEICFADWLPKSPGPAGAASAESSAESPAEENRDAAVPG